MCALSRAEGISSSRREGRSTCAMSCAKKKVYSLTQTGINCRTVSQSIYTSMLYCGILLHCFSFPCIHLSFVLLTLTVLELKI